MAYNEKAQKWKKKKSQKTIKEVNAQKLTPFGSKVVLGFGKVGQYRR